MADGCGADALILDLEDSVALSGKAIARERVTAFLRARPPASRNRQHWVRNPLDGSTGLADLVAVVPAIPYGAMWPKADGPENVRVLGLYLDALEASAGLAVGDIRILPVATETAVAPFRLGDYPSARLSRLAGLTWGRRRPCDRPRRDDELQDADSTNLADDS
jgi:citrate lyase subunit beta/citryl-CoA lyase